MSFFRLVLCLAGLAIYFLAHQAVNDPHRPTESGQAVPLGSPPTPGQVTPADSTDIDLHAELDPPSSELAAQKAR